jgi:8-oxo-dGTP pyrophosphatase MutT (NUDIX family)
MTDLKSGAGALFVSSKTGRVLLNLRAPHKSHNLTWSLWGGMIEGDETPKECLLRELEEEMGFVPEISKIYPFDIYESKDKNFRYYTFVCIVENEFIPLVNHEAVGYCWTKLGVWPKPMHAGAKNALCTRKAETLLNIILSQHQ